jgi:hypothetical protein
MEGYFKRFFTGHLLILMIVACAILYFDKSQAIAILLFVSLIEFLFYYLDAIYLPKRRAKLTDELIEIFNAEPFSEGVLKFKLGTIDFFVKIKIDFKQGLQLANFEAVSFHVPRTQINKISVRHKLNLLEDKINGIQTYDIYQTNGSGLNHAKEELEKII